MSVILEIDDLHVSFHVRDGLLRAVDGVTYSLGQGETLGVVGESGCGKSVTALSILRLIPEPPGVIEKGSIRFQGTDLLTLSESEMQQVRGKDIAMVFQEPMTSLNPVLKIGHQISESFIRHENLSRRDAWDRAVEMLRLVRIPEPKRRMNEYPHHLSGGMRQRVMIAMALVCNPKVLLADEPTTALDVTIQAQILDLLNELQEKLGISILLITHDMGIIAENAQRVVVMYAGRKVEEAEAAELFSVQCHPYTRGLLNCIPRLDTAATHDRMRLNEIEGIVPALDDLPQGCAFAPRCPYASDDCRESRPALEEKLPNHWAACWHTDRLLEAEQG
jgi:oligopeptide/dipeptide ABC transporter ATP-binding protein